MAAVQPFISGAISKTVNMPEEVTVEDVEQLHIDAWQLGHQGGRDLPGQLQGRSAVWPRPRRPAKIRRCRRAEAHDAELAAKVAELEKALDAPDRVVVKQPIRERLPRRRRSTRSPSVSPTAKGT